MPRYWTGSGPTHCDICERPIDIQFVDGATKRGSWANMCIHCFRVHGQGLGLGRGQHYVKTSNGRFLKVEG